MNARFDLSLIALLSLAPEADAQSGLSSLVSSKTPSQQVAPNDVLNAAKGSFRVTVERRLGLESLPEGALPEPYDGAEQIDLERRRRMGAEAVARFEREAEYDIARLQGDGVLFAAEATEALEDARDEALTELSEDVEALAGGYAPPPRRKQFESDMQHRRALLRYVALERNGWRAWAYLLGSALLGFALAAGMLRVSRQVLGSDRRPVLRKVLRKLDGPLYLFLAVGGLSLALRAIWLPPVVHQPVRATLVAAMLAAAFWAAWGLAGAVSPSLRNLATPGDRSSGGQILQVVRKALRIAVILAFAFLAVELLFGTDLTALMAGLGIAGLAVTLAAQDTLKDLLAALTIHANGPFNVGDLVRFQGYLGHAEEIGFRMTRIRTLEGHLVTIPNAKLVSELVENVSARPHVRRRFHLDLPYDTPTVRIRRAVELVREVVSDAGALDDDQEIQVHFDEFGPHSLRLLVQYYFESGDYWKAKEHSTQVDLALVERFREADLDLAFPTQTLHIKGSGRTESPEAGGDEPGGEDDEQPTPAE